MLSLEVKVVWALAAVGAGGMAPVGVAAAAVEVAGAMENAALRPVRLSVWVLVAAAPMLIGRRLPAPFACRYHS